MAAKDFDMPMAEGGGSYSPVHVGTTTAPPNRITLHLGVIDLPYVERAETGKGKKKPKKSAATKTTGEVAEILEEKYGVLDTFAFARLPDIAKALEDSIAGQLETMMMGGNPSGNPFGGAESSITTMMKNFVSLQEIEHMGIEGVPTKAALNGVNHRLKHPYAKANPRRPSFIDTSLYWSTLIAWFD
ncbi:hypothetical protein LMG22037_06453 [Paraburkholderia phenoliruptrix]|uniref:Uncharacterized protein n=1 Tax=Paraburkholderia phenoliruptrix TaxID=252970 RepID=A0A6J5CM01_9BURK|nr:hypothetical protein [Paraburkholderia phenoliruptrix]CAB3741089.1 hypothetical protein LMG22037_06453 [Paraburkholderia phenoliruptrix]